MPYRLRCTHCNTIGTASDFNQELIRDPLCTGDSPTEIEVTCTGSLTKRHAPADVEDVFVCETCETHEPLEGWDDCPLCILSDAYCHTKRYDADDYAACRAQLDDSERVMVEEVIADTINKGRP